MINVLQFICPSGLFGAEMWILGLAKYLNADEVDCRLAVSYDTAHQNLELSERFRQLGLDAHKIRMSGRFDLRAVAKLRELLREEQIDVLHTHGYKSDILGLLAARMAGVRVLATPHGFENAKDLKLRLYVRLGCLALRHFDRVAPLSESLVADMARIRVPEQKTRFIRNGVDLQEVDLEMKRSIESGLRSADEQVIGYVGQLSHRKNLGDMIDAFDLYCRDHGNARLLLVGDGPQRVELQRKANSLESKERIEFLGYRTDRLRIVKELDLFCLTSSLEGIPRCLMEAMAMRVPVVAYDIPGVDKLILDGQTGLQAPYGDMAALKNYWERLLFDGELSKTLAENGRRHVEKNFSAERMAAEYTQLYRELLDRESPQHKQRA